MHSYAVYYGMALLARDQYVLLAGAEFFVFLMKTLHSLQLLSVWQDRNYFLALYSALLF